MAFRKNANTSEDVFTLTLPLRCEPWQSDRLDTLFQCCNNVKNALISRKRKDLKQMERTKAWRQVQAELAVSYAAEQSAKDASVKKAISKERKELFTHRNEILATFGFSLYAFEKAIAPMQKHYKKQINSHVAQKIAASVWDSFQKYLYGDGKAVRFSSINDLWSIEGKNNATGIIYRDGLLHIGTLKLSISRTKKDTYGYEEQALSRTVHYCKISRRPAKEGWQYFAQLVLSGTPPIKVNKNTGELRYPLGSGRVGIDIGTQTIAAVSDSKVCLDVLCEEVQSIEDRLNRLNRTMDRSRRATNPQMFDSAGRIVPIDRLPEPCIYTAHGRKRRKWIKSKRYLHLEQERRYLYAKQADQRRQAHHRLANQLLQFGNTHYVEQMNWKALAKRAKDTTVSQRTSRPNHKKRFGKSVANKAPATLINIYEKKVIAAGGEFHRINTWKAKASQYNHEEKAYKKKHLSQRWQYLQNGIRIQRDLYSAFLIQNTNNTLDGFEQSLLEAKFASFLKLHDAEVQRLTHRLMPSSVGLKYIA